jgi:hypothetical protein
MMSQTEGYPPLTISRKTGDEALYFNQQPVGATVLDFWRWSASDLVSNALRGMFAEYIVAHALGIADGIRAEWEPFDLITPTGIKIEVKSAAYLQTWYHNKLSTISFSIKPSQNWDASTGEYSKDFKRRADIYVFCLLKHQDKQSVDPLDLTQWEFYVLKASTLDERVPMQGKLSLGSLLKLEPLIADYGTLKACVERLGSSMETGTAPINGL